MMRIYRDENVYVMDVEDKVKGKKSTSAAMIVSYIRE